MEHLRPEVECRGCGYLIQLQQALKVTDYFFHPEHFICNFCQCPLFGKPYHPLGDGTFICNNDYEAYISRNKKIIVQDLCKGCKVPLSSSNVIGIGEKKFHKECFNCFKCKRSLVNQKIFQGKNDIICELCFNAGRNKLKDDNKEISGVTGNYTTSAGKHPSTNPDKVDVQSSQFLSNLRNNLLKDKYEDVCKACGEPININEVLKINNNIFHYECIAQTVKVIEGSPKKNPTNPTDLMPPLKSGTKSDNVLLKYQSNIEITCEGCRKVVKTGESVLKVLNQYIFHFECLKCNSCFTILNPEKYYITRDSLFLCLPCSEIRNKEKNLSNDKADPLASPSRKEEKTQPKTMCNKCKGEINGNSLKIFGDNYHSECFCCMKCNKICRDEFFFKNQEFLCIDCYKLEANICKACEKPIMKKMYLRYGLYWHQECLEENIRDSKTISVEEKEVSLNLFKRSGSRPQVITHQQSLLSTKSLPEENDNDLNQHTPGFPKRDSIDITEVLNSIEIEEREYQYRNEKNRKNYFDDDDSDNLIQNQEKINKIMIESSENVGILTDSSISIYSRPNPLYSCEEEKD